MLENLGTVTVAPNDERVVVQLERVASDTVRVLHDRGIPHSGARIDHLVVTPAGVWVVATTHDTGRPERHVDGEVQRLVIGGRDETALVDAVLGQVETVRSVVGGVAVRGVLCIVGAEWPLFGDAFGIGAVDVVGPARLADFVARPTAGAVEVERVAKVLGAHFRPV